MSTAAYQWLNAATGGLVAQKKHQQFFIQIAAGFILVLAILAGTGLISSQSMNELIKNSSQVTQSQEVLESLEKVLNQMTDAETGQLGYLLTGKQRYLETYRAALEQVNPKIAALEKLTADNLNHQQQLNTLKHLIATRLAELKETIDRQLGKGMQPTLQSVQSDSGDHLTDNIHKLIHEMENEENELLIQRSHLATAIRRSTIFNFWAGIFLIFFIIAGIYYIIYRGITERWWVEEQVRAIIATQHDIATAALDLNVVMALIAERTQKLTQASGAVIELVEGDEMVYRSACGTAATHVGVRLKVATSLSGQCVQTGEILYCYDTEIDPRVDLATCRRIGVRSMIVMPLKYDCKVVGVLKVLSPLTSAFGDRDRDTLQLMAGLLAAVINHASEFEAKQQVESALRLAYDELELRVSERTKELATANVALQMEIAQRQQAQSELSGLFDLLETERGQMESILNSMTDGLIVGDLAGNVLTMNPAALRLHEYQNTEEVQRHLREFTDTFELRYLGWTLDSIRGLALVQGA